MVVLSLLCADAAKLVAARSLTSSGACLSSYLCSYNSAKPGKIERESGDADLEGKSGASFSNAFSGVGGASFHNAFSEEKIVL